MRAARKRIARKTLMAAQWVAGELRYIDGRGHPCRRRPYDRAMRWYTKAVWRGLREAAMPPQAFSDVETLLRILEDA